MYYEVTNYLVSSAYAMEQRINGQEVSILPLIVFAFMRIHFVGLALRRATLTSATF